jgi:signal transduction histidine kinase/ActR/RegA family two-component response regulator
VDVTAQQRADEEFRRSQGLLAATLESTSDGMCVVDNDRQIVCCNQKFVEMWKIPDSVMATRNDNHLLTFALDQVKDPAKFLAKVRSLYGQPDAESYDVVEFKDGRLFERYSQPYRHGGKALGRVWSFRDITERKWGEEALEKALKESEEQLRQSQKLEAIGQLAGGVAHDFNNLLTIIAGYSQLVSNRLTADNPIRKDVEAIKEAADRAASLTRQLLTFSRKQVFETQLVDLNAVVAELGDMLQRLLGSNIELVTTPHAGLGLVRADPRQLQQVIINLAINARDAMPEGGRLDIETGEAVVAEGDLPAGASLKPGPYVVATVRDSGHGMAKEVQEHIFEPFFTTKEPGKGTGLGLAMAYGSVTQVGGHLSVESEIGQGTAFKIWLPRVETAAVPSQADTAAGAKKGSETVLLVEDDPSVRAFVGRTLRLYGYTVLEAPHGIEALLVGSRYVSAIHLLLTDIVMPQMNGREVARRFAEIRPAARVLYMSGYVDDAAIRQGVSQADMPLLQKPFTPDALARKVREVLDGGVRRPMDG